MDALGQHTGLAPSAWVLSCLEEFPADQKTGRALDLACGSGRHARLLHQLGFEVVAVDRDEQALARVGEGIQTRHMDLEQDDHWPLAVEKFDVVVALPFGGCVPVAQPRRSSYLRNIHVG